MRKIIAAFFLFLTFALLSFPAAGFAAGHGDSSAPAVESSSAQPGSHEAAGAPHPALHQATHPDIGSMLPLWTVIPFAGILLSIALFPLFAPHFWHHHYPKVSLAWALAFAVPFLAVFKGAALYEIAHIYIIDYIPFIILLGGLFTVAGGIHVKGSLKGSPAVNTVILLFGTLLASWIGTTGAAMVLIRPVLRSNSWRKHKVHTIIFFIFLVCNIGGSLTPLGDPPLFLGFLHGVPFFWTFKLIAPMGFCAVILLAAYFALDSFYYRKEDFSRADSGEKEPLAIEGAYNFIFLAGIVGAVLFSGLVSVGEISFFGIHQTVQNLVKDGIIIAMGALSMVITKKAIREENEFSWEPIKEVAYLFAGIFMTIIPALAILKAGSHGALAFLVQTVEKPSHYFWASGSLSSFLDNAPTYLTYFNTALGKFFPGQPESVAVRQLISDAVIPGHGGLRYSDYLLAISCGAVFMGANTYIGNAPNFMVKSIAEEAGVNMPSFFGYMFKYSIPILVVLFVIVTLVFF
jgi:Na+/H+ antiporter NhaD/arsenite permease-like protein